MRDPKNFREWVDDITAQAEEAKMIALRGVGARDQVLAWTRDVLRKNWDVDPGNEEQMLLFLAGVEFAYLSVERQLTAAGDPPAVPRPGLEVMMAMVASTLLQCYDEVSRARPDS